MSVLLKELHRAPCPDDHHTRLMLFGCDVCGIAWPFPSYNFALLTPAYQRVLVALAERRGYRWPHEHHPVADAE